MTESTTTQIKRDSTRFWGELYQATYSEFDQNLSPAELRRLLGELEQMFRHGQYPAGIELPLDQLSGKKVLEIGSGAGAHSALFALHGARITAIDLASDRVQATAHKFNLLAINDTGAMHTDAECLPFPNAYFDIVYSYGVLHHTPNTEAAIKEVFRVLKPNGRAVIMLYAKHSFYYLMIILKAIIRGNIRQANWLGRSTEWMANKPQTVYNPVTKVYSKSDIRHLFYQFQHLYIRQVYFHFWQIPYLGRLLERWAKRIMPVNEAGMLVYGHPSRYETSLELWLGQWLGYHLLIVANK